MRYRIVNPKQTLIFLVSVLLLLALAIYGGFYLYSRTPALSQKDQEKYLEKFLSSQKKDASLFAKSLETREMKALKEKNPVLSAYSQKRNEGIVKLREEIITSIERNKLGLPKTREDKTKISQTKFLKKLLTRPYQSTKNPKEETWLVLNELKATENFKTYTYEEKTREILPTLNLKKNQLQTQEAPYNLFLSKNSSESLEFNRKSNATASKVTWKLKDNNAFNLQVHDNQVLYREVKGGIDQLLTTTPQGLTNVFILKTPQSLTLKDQTGILTLEYTLDSSQLKIEEEQGALVFQSEEGTKHYVLTPPTIKDLNNQATAQAKFILESNTENTDPDEVQVVPLTLIHSAQAEIPKNSYSLKVEVTVNSNAAFPLLLSYDLLPVLSRYLKEEESVSKQQKDFLKELGLEKKSQTSSTSGSDYLSDIFGALLSPQAQELLRRNPTAQGETLTSLTSSEMFTSRIELPQKEEETKEKENRPPDDPRNLPQKDSNQLIVQTSFDNLDDQISQTINYKNQKTQGSFKARLQNLSNLSQSVYQGEKGDTKVYFGQNEIITYTQTQETDNKKIQLKENIYAKEPNLQDSSTYVWKFSAANENSRIALKEKEDGSVEVYEEIQVAGVDPENANEQQRVMDLVKQVFTNAQIGNGEPIALIQPLTYVLKDGTRKTAKYQIDKDTLTLNLKEDPDQYPLLIDPTFEWGAWLGGTMGASDYINALVLGNDEEIYIGGNTDGAASNSFNQIPTYIGGTNSGSIEAFVAEITDNASAAPTFNWLQWLGGTYNDYFTSLAVTGDEIYAGGYSDYGTGWENPNYTGGSYSSGSFEGFVVELADNASAAPTLNWLQWLGGPDGDGVLALAVSEDEIYAGGYTYSETGWEVPNYTGGTSNWGDGFVAEFIDNASAAPTFNWLQWLGGGAIGIEEVRAVAVNGDEIYAGGVSGSDTFDGETIAYIGGTMSGSTEGFVVELYDNSSAAPTVNWLQWLGGTNGDYVQALAVTGEEVYADGYSSNSVWDGETFTYTGGTYSGSNEGFVIELVDNAGAAPTLNWLQWLGGTGNDYVNALAVTSDEIYAGGSASTTFDGEIITYTGGTHSGSAEGFVVELADNAGAAPTLNWLQWLGGTSSDSVSVLALSGDEIYAGGSASTTFAGETITYTGGTHSGSTEGFVVEFADNESAAPTLNWLQWLGGTKPGSEEIKAIVINDNQEIYVGGYSASEASFTPATYTGGTHSGGSEGFVAELADNPSAVPTLNWLQWLGGTGVDYVYALALSGDEIYAGGYAYSTTFAGETITYTGGAHSGNYEGFVVELADNESAAPTLNWLQWLGGTGGDSVSVLALSGDEIYAGGYAYSTVFDETATYVGGTNSGGAEGFVVELTDNAGAAPTLNWLQWLGGTSNDYVYTLAVTNDEIYAGGYAGSSSTTFAGETITYTGGSHSGGAEGFVVELADNESAAPTLNWLQWLGGTDNDNVYALAVANDEIYAGGYAGSSSTTFAGETITYTGGTHSGSDEGFVAELYDNESAAPTLNWLQWLGGTSSDSVDALALSGDEIYAGGYAYSATSWEAPTYTGGTYSGNYEGFVVELADNEGSAPTVNWLQWLGGTGYDSVSVLALSGDEIYAGGYASAVISEASIHTLGSYSGNTEALLAKIKDDIPPTVEWFDWLGATGNNYIYALAVNGDEIYVGGYAGSDTSFESQSYTGGTYSGNREGFVAELADNASAAPTLNWLQWLGGTSDDYVRGVAVTGDEIYAGGYGNSTTASFETATYTGGTNSGSFEGFIVEIADNEGAAPTLTWLQWLGGSGADYIYAVGVNSDEIYAAGNTTSSSLGGEFPAYTGGSYTSGASGYEGFVAEFADNASSSPTFNWLQWLGGSGNDYVMALAVNSDEIYAGGYAGSATSWEVPIYTGGSYSGAEEGFVAEIADNEGADPTLNWLQWLGSTTADYVWALTVTGDEVYAGGSTSSATWGGETPTYDGGSLNSYEGFVVELADNPATYPTFNWRQWLGGTSSDYVYALAVTGDEIYAAGYSNSTSFTTEAPTYGGGTQSGDYEAFVAELTDNASAAPTFNWLEWLGGTDEDYSRALALDGDEVYVGGWAGDDNGFESFTYEDGTHSDSHEGFVVELADNSSSAPSTNWREWLGSPAGSFEYIRAVGVSPDGEVYAGGYTDSQGSFYSATPNYTGGTNSGGTYEAFVVEISQNEGAAPALNWLQWLGGTGADYIYALAVNGDEIYAGGSANSTTSFEAPTYTGGTHSGSDEAFVAELVDNEAAAPTFEWLHWLGGSSGDYTLALAVSGDEIYAGGYCASTTISESPTYTGGSQSGGNEGFVAEFLDNASAAPTFNWLQWLGGTGADYLYGLAVSGDEIYAGGYSASNVNFESSTYSPGGDYTSGDEAFVVELIDNASAAPTVEWLYWLGGTGTDRIYALAASGEEIFAGGYATAVITETPTYTGGAYSTSYEGFVAKFIDNPSANPTFNWLQWLGGSSYNYVYALALAGNEIYVGGNSNSASSWEIPNYSGGVYTAALEGFVIELSDRDGSAPVFNWRQWLGGSGYYDYVYGLAVDGDSIYAGGYFESTANLETALYTGGNFSGNYEGLVFKLLDASEVKRSFLRGTTRFRGTVRFR